MKEYISREIERKQQFLEGQQRYSELYADVIKAKKLAKEEAAKVEQKLEKENTRPKLETENHPKYMNDKSIAFNKDLINDIISGLLLSPKEKQQLICTIIYVKNGML